MRVRSLAVTASIASSVIVTTVFAQSPRYLPEYTPSGDLILPKNFHEWVYVGSPLTPNAANAKVERSRVRCRGAKKTSSTY